MKTITEEKFIAAKRWHKQELRKIVGQQTVAKPGQ